MSKKWLLGWRWCVLSRELEWRRWKAVRRMGRSGKCGSRIGSCHYQPGLVLLFKLKAILLCSLSLHFVSSQCLRFWSWSCWQMIIRRLAWSWNSLRWCCFFFTSQPRIAQSIPSPTTTAQSLARLSTYFLLLWFNSDALLAFPNEADFDTPALQIHCLFQKVRNRDT